MDKVFRAIGRFFKSIWDWIKQTAWVQPLLIVAIIFGIIFSINPIVNAIKGAVNADTTGNFYKAHNVETKMNYIFGGIQDQDPSYYKRTPKINANSGYSMVIIYNSDSYDIESDVRSFYNSSTVNGLKTKCNLYAINLKYSDNQYSKYDEFKKEYVTVDEKKSIYADYLAEKIVATYNGQVPVTTDENGKPLYWKGYNDSFKHDYNYQIFYKFSESTTIDDNYPQSAEGGITDLKLPAALKFYGDTLVDMRFATGTSFSSYKTDAPNIEILTDLWVGADYGNLKKLS